VLADCNQVDSNTTSVTVSWQPRYAGVFYIYRHDNSPITTTNETSVVITGLIVDTTYTFNVTVHGRNVTGNSVTCQATTCMLPPNVCLVLVIPMDCCMNVKNHCSHREQLPFSYIYLSVKSNILREEKTYTKFQTAE